MTDRTLASRYAKALYELAEEKNALAQTGAELEAFSGEMKSRPELSRLFENPSLAPEQKCSALAELIRQGAFSLSPLLHRFLELILKKARFTALRSVFDAYRELLREQEGVRELLITTAKPLKAETRKTLEALAAKRSGFKIVSTVKVEPRLLGGLSFRLKNRLFDYSLKTKLDRLRNEMVSAC